MNQYFNETLSTEVSFDTTLGNQLSYFQISILIVNSSMYVMGETQR